MRVVVTADTHLRRDWPNRRLPAAAQRWLASADVILHAGDITQPGVGDQRLFNPGSPTERRRMPHRTIGVLELDDGRVVDHRIEVVDD